MSYMMVRKILHLFLNAIWIIYMRYLRIYISNDDIAILFGSEVGGLDKGSMRC